MKVYIHVAKSLEYIGISKRSKVIECYHLANKNLANGHGKNFKGIIRKPET